jgi:hypothetical protein
MTNLATEPVSHVTERLTIEIDSPTSEFIACYEAAVPTVPTEQITEMVARRAPWEEMVSFIAEAAPFGFLIYDKNHLGPVMQLAGHIGDCVAYLMGNHTIAERMYRYDRRAMLHAPLRTLIWEDQEGRRYFTVDRPSNQFESYGNDAISAVGVELDEKLAALLKHLGLVVPTSLSSSDAAHL